MPREETPSAEPEEPEAEAVEASPEEDEEEVVYAGHAVPELDELRDAMHWAFQAEEMPEGMLETFARHARMLLERNTQMNLTSIVEPREVAAKHYLDSWQATRLLPLLGKRALDVGSGAGFPGLPVAMAEPHAHVVLIDSKKKKADFIQECIDELGIQNATVVCDRAEEHLARNRYDLVFMRAISSVRENVRLLRKVRHSLYDLVMLKGPSWSREVRAGEREAERLGFRLDTVWEHELPGELGKRAVLVYRAPGGAGR
jgi:16S rRNA (guanine527-N7)-methyltransferase